MGGKRGKKGKPSLGHASAANDPAVKAFYSLQEYDSYRRTLAAAAATATAGPPGGTKQVIAQATALFNLPYLSGSP